MNHIRQIDPVHSTGKVRELLTAVETKLGFIPNFVRVLGNSSAALEGYLRLRNALEGGALSSTMREQIALAVAEMNDCSYCLSFHTILGGKAGLTLDEIHAARRVKATKDKSDATLKLARALTLQHGQLANSDLQAARNVGITDEEIVEVLLHVALNILTNYTNNAARTVIDFPLVVPGEIGPTARNADK